MTALAKFSVEPLKTEMLPPRGGPLLRNTVAADSAP